MASFLLLTTTTNTMFLNIFLMLAVLAVAFLLGSIPWGIVISRLFYRTDIREHGSGNIGTTNAMRTLGKRGGVAVFVLDFGKGLLAGVFGLLISVCLPLISSGQIDSSQAASSSELVLRQQDFLAISLAGCTLGHVFSPWLKFKGGKGIAVAAGCLFFTFGWLATLAEIALFALLVLITRYVSIGSLAAAAACPLMALWLFWGDWIAVAFCAVTGLIIIWAHRGNMKRLATGSEHRIGKERTE